MDKRKLLAEERGLRLLEIVMALMAVGFYVLCLVSADDARADDRRINLRPEEHNGDFINRFAEMGDSEASVNSVIFDTAMAKEMREKYDGFSRPYLAKKEYRLNAPEDEMNYQQSNADFVQWTVKRLLQYHFEHTVKNKVEESAKQAAANSNSPAGRAAASAVSTVQSVQKALNNGGTLNLGQETTTKFKYDFPSGVMRVGMVSPLVDTTMDYRIKPADPVVGAIQQPERLSLGLNRNFKEIGASTNAHYSLMNGTLNYGVVKHVTGPVTAQVDEVHNIRDTSKDETVYRVNLGFNF